MKKNGNQKIILIALGLMIFVGFWVAIFLFDKHQHEIVLSFKCFNKSDEECYMIYSDIFNEESAHFRKRKLALIKMIDLGETAIQLIIDELTSRNLALKKKALLINAMANIEPNIYCDILAGPPYSEIKIDNQMAKRIFAVSFLKKASISSAQRNQILKLIESFGDDYKSEYEDYKKFCDSQK